jgi:hypothetical protein
MNRYVGLWVISPPTANGFFHRRSPVLPHGVLHKKGATMRILKLWKFWALTIGTSALLLSGIVQAYDPDDRISPSRPGIFPGDSVKKPDGFFHRRSLVLPHGVLHSVESALSARPQWSADADVYSLLGSRLQFRFAPMPEDRVEGYSPTAMEGFSDLTLRWGPIRSGRAPFLPWTEFYPDHYFKEGGLSSERDLRGKGIDDRLRGSAGHLRGGYFQVGYFFQNFWERVPGSLEITGRVALAGTSTSARSDLLEEWTLGASWFFRGLSNKITANVSYRELDQPDAAESGTSFNVRWDISF